MGEMKDCNQKTEKGRK